MLKLRLPLSLAAIWLLFVAAVYLPDIGRGFVKDDFFWVETAERALHQPAWVLTSESSGGFLRPVVALSFAADRALYGLNARLYGFTNLLLYIATTLATMVLFTRLGLSLSGAAIGAFVWAVNPSGLDMAVLWLSGRSSLLMTLFSLLSAIAFVGRRRPIGTVFLTLALFSKEDAVTLPIVLLACVFVSGTRGRELRHDATAMILALAVYLLARSHTAAMTPWNAPWFYQPTWDIRLILRNALEYMDRGATSATILSLGAMCLYRSTPLLTKQDRRLLTSSGIWFAAALAITVRLPVRSNLYAVFPSVASALAAAVVIEAARRRWRARLSSESVDRRLQIAFASVLLLAPIYGIRNDRYVEPARVSNRTMRVLLADLDHLPREGTLVFQDESTRFSNFNSAFDGFATEAVRVYTHLPITARVVAERDVTRASGEVARYRLSLGRVHRIQE